MYYILSIIITDTLNYQQKTDFNKRRVESTSSCDCSLSICISRSALQL